MKVIHCITYERFIDKVKRREALGDHLGLNLGFAKKKKNLKMVWVVSV